MTYTQALFYLAGFAVLWLVVKWKHRDELPDPTEKRRDDWPPYYPR